LTEFNAQVNRLFTVVIIISEKKNADKELIQQQTSYIKVIKTHLHVVSHHGLKKKPTSMIKIKLLQLEKSHCQTHLFEDMLDSYCAVVHCHFSLTIHALTDVFQNNLSALKHVVIASAESVKRKDDNKSASLYKVLCLRFTDTFL